MEKRNLVDNLGGHLTEKVKNLNIRFEEICNDKGYISEKYKEILKEPTQVIEDLFFENASSNMRDRFIKCSLSIDIDRFYITYQKIGRNGLRSFINCIENNIALI